VQELPALVAASKAYTASGVNVIIISVDASAASKVPLFLSRLGLAGTPIFWDPRSDLYKKFAVQLLPTTIVLNGKGQEVGRMAGAVGWQGQADIEFLKQAASRL